MTAEEQDSPEQVPTPRQSLGAMWLYSALRFLVFFVIFGVLWLARVPGFLAAVIAVFLSVPLSFVLLRKPRERLARNIELRVNARRDREQDLDKKLSGGEDDNPPA
ncbi:MAG: hypothetical protein JWN95_1979 [Frankiales bacterium]|nr:hypothetical protein [Frankiales bacterium]